MTDKPTGATYTTPFHRRGALIGAGLAADRGWALLPVQIDSVPLALTGWVEDDDCGDYVTFGGTALIGQAQITALDRACSDG